MTHAFTVGELTRAIKDVLTDEFPFVWVRGQVANLARPGSGHIYFSLKDAEASLNVVWFKSNQWSGTPGDQSAAMPGGLPGGLAEGAQVVCAGRIDVYAPRGVYQLIAELVRAEGVGDLWLAFEALKRKLAGLGWFEPAAKKPVPRDPRRVAVVTAPTGAAVRDFLRVASERGLGAEVRVYPALVQGEAAPGLLAEAIHRVEAGRWAEVLVLIRGGGSIEDLHAFNDETVAAAVHECALPVVCGVGHEVDVTICDLVADLRAATPSHAAQLLFSEREQLAQRVDEAETRLRSVMARSLDEAGREVDGLARLLAGLGPAARLREFATRLGRQTDRLRAAYARELERRESALAALAERLALAGGSDGSRTLAAHEERLAALAARLLEAGRRLPEVPAQALDALAGRLEAVSPEAVLARGYSLAFVAEGPGRGRLARSPADAPPGTLLDVRLAEGGVYARVEEEGGA